jgi:hypothetical protein
MTAVEKGGRFQFQNVIGENFPSHLFSAVPS